MDNWAETEVWQWPKVTWVEVYVRFSSRVAREQSPDR